MRAVQIVHLYPDRMNIYGDFGNIIALQKRLEWRGLKHNYIPVTIGDKLPKQADIIFMGGGQDRGQILVAEDMQHKKSELYELVESGVPALTICGGYQLFGEYFMSGEYGELPGIHIFNVVTRATDTRMIGNLEVESEKFGKLIGFENHSGATELFDDAQPLGRVLKGYGNTPSSETEGIMYKNAIGTYLHGSFLPKNPVVTDFLLTQALYLQEPNFELEKLDDEIEHKARVAAIKRPQ